MPQAMTSQSHPIDVRFVPAEHLPTKGAVGFTLAPGRRGPGVAGLHDRDLGDDLARLRTHYGINVVVSLVPDEEATRRTGITSAMEKREVEARGMAFHHVPVEAGRVPDEDGLVALVQQLRDDLMVGKKVVVHDRAGGGRSAAVVAALLIGMGHAVADAVAKVRSVREKAIEPYQEKQLRALDSRLAERTSPLLARVEEVLKGAGCNYKRVPGMTMVQLGLIAKGLTVPLLVTTMEKPRYVSVFGRSGIFAPPAARAAVGELLHRLNWSLVIGTFELDHTDGEVRFRVSVDVEGGDLAPEMVRNMIACTVHHVAQFRPAIEAVASLRLDASDAIGRSSESLN